VPYVHVPTLLKSPLELGPHERSSLLNEAAIWVISTTSGTMDVWHYSCTHLPFLSCSPELQWDAPSTFSRGTGPGLHTRAAGSHGGRGKKRMHAHGLGERKLSSDPRDQRQPRRATGFLDLHCCYRRLPAAAVSPQAPLCGLTPGFAHWVRAGQLCPAAPRASLARDLTAAHPVAPDGRDACGKAVSRGLNLEEGEKAIVFSQFTFSSRSRPGAPRTRGSPLRIPRRSHT